MCGIAGIVTGQPENPSDVLRRLRDMTRTLRRRGPNSEGFYHSALAYFGHRRLSVIDLDAGGQPMESPDGKVVLVFNGEIYNFGELRKELESAGRTFRTHSDTEVLLEGYLEWGEAVVGRLNGMFAFAFWDARSNTLFAARDRMGKKPFYWHCGGGRFLFGSELSALLATGWVPKNPNPSALRRFLALSYLGGEESAIEGVYRLPPASCLRWRPGDAAPNIWLYWDLAQRWRTRQAEGTAPGSRDEEFLALLQDAVRIRMVADVPLGSFLSGGLDSSVITALMRRESSEVHSFSIGFNDPGFDESAAAAKTAEYLETRHQMQRLGDFSQDYLLRVAGELDEPFADTSLLSTYALCQMARQNITVALSGDGADELLAGYPTMLADRYYARLAWLPGRLAGFGRCILRRLPQSRRKMNLLFKARQFLSAFPLPACEAHASWRIVLPDAVRARLAQDGTLESIYAIHRRHFAATEGFNMLDRFLYVDMKTWLVDDILTKADRASMNHGLEVRSPFLDYRLVEFAAGLPPEAKLGQGRNKRILRDAATRFLTPALLCRKKTGFNSPVAFWLCRNWREAAEEAFSGSLLEENGVCDRELLQQTWSEHSVKRRDHGYFLFSALMLYLWLKQLRG